MRKNSLILSIKFSNLYIICLFLKFNSVFFVNPSMDIRVIDHISSDVRFEVTYSFWCISYGKRLFLKLFINTKLALLSIKNLFSSSDWLEREIWDMYGLKFILHGDLRRISTDYGFKGHPLRKDFPLIGYVELRYDDIYQLIVLEPLKFHKDFVFLNMKILG